MAIEHINEFDTLNAGREKINKFAIDPANRAELNSIDAKSVANQAKQTSQNAEAIAINTDDRLDNIIVGEMQDAEVIDARRPFGGETYATLGERLDSDKAEVSAQLTQIKKQGLIPVTHFGVTGDGVTDNSSALQEYVSLMETEGLPYMYLPTFNQNYFINKSIKFHEPDVRIFGDKGLQLLHPSDVTLKKGNIIVGSNATTAFDIGDYRTKPSGNNPSRNPSGSWVVEGLSFIQDSAVQSGQSNGLELTGMQNGPDRPVLLTKLSFNRLKNAIYSPKAPSDVSIMLANLNINNISAYNNKRGIYLDGQTYNLTVKESNLENNTEGCVWGNVSGSVDISNNMLELTKNPINISTGSGGASLHFKSEGNYFEYHPTSDYLYYLDTGAYFVDSSVKIKDNFYSGNIDMEFPVQLTGASRTTIDSQYKVLFDRSKQTVLSDSKVLENNGGFYAFNQLGKNDNYLTQSSNLMVYMDDGFNRTDSSAVWLHDYPIGNTKEADTPLGRMNVKDMSTGFRLNQEINATVSNQLIVINLMVKADVTDTDLSSVNASAFSIFDQSYNGVLDFGTGLSDIIHISKGKWVMVSIPLVVNKNTTALNIMSNDALAKNILIAGATSKQFGNYNNDGSDAIKKIYPVRPNYKGITS